MSKKKDGTKSRGATGAPPASLQQVENVRAGWLPERTALSLLVFVAGVVLMGLEIAGSRVLAPHFGNSVFVWGSLISVFLIALAVGYYVGGRLADRQPSMRLLSAILVAAAIWIFVLASTGRAVGEAVWNDGFGLVAGPLVAAAILFLPPSVALGIVSPFAVRMATTSLGSAEAEFRSRLFITLDYVNSCLPAPATRIVAVINKHAAVMSMASQRPGWKSWLTTIVRWSLLADALATALLALLTALKCPVWLGWVMGMIVPECAHWFALLTLAFATVAWLLRRGHSILTTVTLSLCGVAFLLFLKPTAQAWQLGHSLPAQLEEAFGSATPQRNPFSVQAMLFGGPPQPVPIETMRYSGSLLLDFYRAVGRSSAPCVVVIHGGSWVGGNRLDDGTTRWLNDWLAHRGYAVASIDYRLSPEFIWPAQRDDLLSAIEYLRGHASKLGIDPTQFVLFGRSAGGQMAPATAYWKHDPTIRGIIAIYPPTDFYLTWESATHPGNLDHRLNLEWFLGGTPDTARAAYDSASAALFADAGAPPTLIIHGKLDINVFHKQAELLAEKLAGAKVPHALISLPWAAHGFDLITFNSPGSQIEAYAVDWFLQTITH